jgi:bifunctional non-homologous end joining protein LigD
MSLNEYKKKRRFDVTPEPAGREEREAGERSALSFVVQKHQATRLHYDFRLEWKGVMLSWAVPKGPSLDPSVKRLAMPVEDHPIEYNSFEGVIPEGEYGGGTVMIWDRGTWKPQVPDVDEAIKQGDLKFTLDGKKLKGSWVLVRTGGGWQSSGRPSWLLIKHRDEFISTRDITVELPLSVLSKKSMEQIARANHGNVEKAAEADPSGPAAKVGGAKSSGAKRPAGKTRAAASGSKKSARKK